jgi:hypothetical protein
LLLWTYKKFLIGSKVLEKLVVTSSDQLATLAQVALNYPKSLQQLREVENRGYIHESLHQVYNFDDKKDIFDQHIKVYKSAQITMKLSSSNFYLSVLLRADDQLSQTGEDRNYTSL